MIKVKYLDGNLVFDVSFDFVQKFKTIELIISLNNLNNYIIKIIKYSINILINQIIYKKFLFNFTLILNYYFLMNSIQFLTIISKYKIYK